MGIGKSKIELEEVKKIINQHFNSENEFIIEFKQYTDYSYGFNIYNPLQKNISEPEEIDEYPYERCLIVTISEYDKSIELGYLNNCGIKNGGSRFLKSVKEFAKKYGYKKIDLQDASVIIFYGENQKEQTISLQQMKVMKEGISWYGKYGFTNKYYIKNKEKIINFINSPLKNIIENEEHYKELIDFMKTFHKNVKKNITISEYVTLFESYIKQLDCIDANRTTICSSDTMETIRKINYIINLLYITMLNTIKVRHEDIQYVELIL